MAQDQSTNGYMPAAMDQAAILRGFAGPMSAALGLGADQNWLDEDFRMSNPVNVGTLYNPQTGGTVITGTTVGDVQTGGKKPWYSTPIMGTITPAQLGAGLAMMGMGWYLFKRGR